jgi:hypothetical protein
VSTGPQAIVEGAFYALLYEHYNQFHLLSTGRISKRNLRANGVLIAGSSCIRVVESFHI